MIKFKNIIKIFNKPYKYGFSTKIKIKKFPKGLNLFIINLISKIKNEPYFIKKFRKDSFNKWKILKIPKWQNLDIPFINFNEIVFYSEPILKKEFKILNPKIKKIISKLDIKFDEKTSKDFVLDSKSLNISFREKLSKYGIIFCSITEAIKYYPNLINKFLGTVVSKSDNFFAALNSCVFSDGSFCYIPQNTICPLNLSTYFRINNKNSGQFERTLIIVEKNSELNYIEGCSAIKDSKNQLHSAIVEILVFDNSKVNYSTIQNWFGGNKNGKGGIFNFVTKRGICFGNNSKLTWTQIEIGALITWKYPSCILIGKSSEGYFYSVALTKNNQQTDTGTKMIHLGLETKSFILSKSICLNFSKNSYRSLVKILPTAKYSYNYSQCDSIILSKNVISSTYPYFDISNSLSSIEHEAKILKLSEEQLFYLLQRGFNKSDAIIFIINGFCKEIFNNLTLEYALEVTNLLSITLDGNI